MTGPAAEQALEDVSHLLARRVGLRLDHAIRARLVNAVRDEAEARDLSLAAYVASLDADPQALQDLLNRVTVQETAFFRDPGQFAGLASELLPVLAAEGAPVRIWSAGCANGQEAYSLAMSLAESGIGDWQVIASDISTDAIARTRLARYAEREITGLSPERRARHLRPAGTDWEIDAALRARVRVLRHNLVADVPPWSPGECQIVFCRNVLIYFDRANVVTLLGRLVEWMPIGGYLFLGYSESLWQLSDDLKLVRIGDAFAYRNRGVRRPAGSSVRRAAAPAASTPPASGSSRVTPAADPPAPGRPARTGAAAAADTGGGVAPPPRRALFARGESALERGDPAAAIAAFRQAVYLDHDDPVAHLNLALALDAGGDAAAARRAYAAGRAALDRCDPATVEAALEGYHLDELTRLFEQRAERP